MRFDLLGERLAYRIAARGERLVKAVIADGVVVPRSVTEHVVDGFDRSPRCNAALGRYSVWEGDFPEFTRRNRSG